MRIIFIYLILIISTTLTGCMKERYRKDPASKMTRKARKSNDYLAVQANQITEDNLSQKEQVQKTAEKRKKKEQKELHELNKKSSRVKRETKHHGHFKIY